MPLPGTKVSGRPPEEIGILLRSLKRALIAKFGCAFAGIRSNAKDVPHRWRTGMGGERV